ncbi:tetratricopeptide repeat protein [Actinomycetospora sp. TBRC 11914]|uniref:tetratricopeptide repeat protein n=1 Tax=Actinomycetospora sp. TBRC 11914 TaxID=2729387 RepID=UPI00145E87A5|nr:tetratricopeptide repeat protein [Actinomycetospora sp. TBRC 11914]NMO88207.1 tetratricopeptide repeat protein [Actinomycetospora sp. TBRC 11914]
MRDQLIFDIGDSGRARISIRIDEQSPKLLVKSVQLTLPLSIKELEELRWYLEDYAQAPYGVYNDRAVRIASEFREWGQRLFSSILSSQVAREAYAALRERSSADRTRPQIMLRSARAEWLGLPWELLAEPSAAVPAALETFTICRSVLSKSTTPARPIPGRRLRVLMVIARPDGPRDVSYRMIARPLLRRLAAVGGEVDLVVLRPPTFAALEASLRQAADSDEPFQIVHFDGHGALNRRGDDSDSKPSAPPLGEAIGTLAFERFEGGPDHVPAAQVARVLGEARVPVVVLNACQSGALSKTLESAIATSLLAEGASSVVAMAYTISAVAAAEFMAAFYESIFAGQPVADAVMSGRVRLARNDRRPSPRGELRLADWVVPVHYQDSEAHFAGLAATPASREVPLNAALDQLRARPAKPELHILAQSFVGRDDMYHSLETAARLRPTILLYGLAGRGKTELARAFGEWWCESGAIDRNDLLVWDFADPDIDASDVEAIVDAIGHRVFGTAFSERSTAARRSSVLAELNARRMLIILDNFEHACSMPGSSSPRLPLTRKSRDEFVEFLHDIGSGGQSLLLFTSRSPELWLGSEVLRIPLPRLNAQEAAEYADQLLSPLPAARAKRAERGYEDLMSWLDGHPLYMRVTLPQLARVGPEELLMFLRGLAPHGQDWDGDILLPLSASLANSVDYLDGTQQRLLTAVSLFHGVVSVHVLTAFSSMDGVPQRFAHVEPDAWTDTLEAAAAVGLVAARRLDYSVHPGLALYLIQRWRHESSNEFSAEILGARQALLSAYGGYAQVLTKEIDSGQGEAAMALVEVESRNLTDMLAYSLESKRWTEGYHIAVTLNSLWSARGQVAEAQNWVARVRLCLEGGDGSPPEFDSVGSKLWILMVGAGAALQIDAHSLKSAYDSYIEVRDGVIRQVRSEARDYYLATTYHQLGMICRMQGAFSEARQWLQQALAISEELRDRAGMARDCDQLGLLAERQGDLNEASSWYVRALSARSDAGDQTTLATSYSLLGAVDLRRGALDKAERWFQQSLKANEVLGSLPGLASNYDQLSEVAHARGEFGKARRLLRRALVVHEQLGQPQDVAATYHKLGVLAKNSGALDEAESWLRRSLSIAQDSQDLKLLASNYMHLGNVAHLQNRFEDAHRLYSRSLAVWEQLGDRPSVGVALDVLALLAEDMKDPHEALRLLVRAVLLFDRFVEPPASSLLDHLAVVVEQLGFEALSDTWAQVTDSQIPNQMSSLLQVMVSLKRPIYARPSRRGWRRFWRSR